MSDVDPIAQWLAGCTLAPGMSACAVRRADGACLIQGNVFPPEKLEAALQRLAAAWPQLSAGLVPRWLTWTFGQGQLRAVARPDGFLLALVAEPNTPAAQNLDLFSSEFLALDFGG